MKTSFDEIVNDTVFDKRSPDQDDRLPSRVIMDFIYYRYVPVECFLSYLLSFPFDD